MKKTYINPEIEVVKMVINHQLLDGSTLSVDLKNEGISDEADLLSREADFDFDNF